MRLPGRPDPQPTKNPRKVRGGVKLTSRDRVAESWASQRWLRVMEQHAEPGAQLEGLEYARAGQARRLDLATGVADALVQGRMPRAYHTRVTLAPLTDEQINEVVRVMADSAVYAAKLLSRELPPSIEDLFAPLGLRLFPASNEDLQVSCTCGGQGWCKHACCVAYLVAERLAGDPTLMLMLRGLTMDELVERLRQLRSRPDASQGPAPVYSPHLPTLAGNETLEESAAWFWDGREDLSMLDLPIAPPAVSHPLLRRLGPSPFQGARFPLVGLLATCYDVISQAVVNPPGGASGNGVEGGEEPDASSDGPTSEGSPEAD